jgi:hypothetical protein
MSLTYGQIEAFLLEGISFSSQRREFVAKANPDNDLVAITEMSGLRRVSLPLEFIVDRAGAHESGSDVADVAALKQLLGVLTIRAI